MELIFGVSQSTHLSRRLLWRRHRGSTISAGGVSDSPPRGVTEVWVSSSQRCGCPHPRGESVPSPEVWVSPSQRCGCPSLSCTPALGAALQLLHRLHFQPSRETRSTNTARALCALLLLPCQALVAVPQVFPSPGARPRGSQVSRCREVCVSPRFPCAGRR